MDDSSYAWEQACIDRDIAKAKADRLLELLREGLEATTQADGHWSDRVRWMNWVEKVEKELGDD